MGTRSRLHILLVIAAAVAAAFLMMTYGTVLPGSPFTHIALDGPVAIDSDGETTAVIDTKSSRVLILDSNDQLTGIVNCMTPESPFDTIVDACVSDGIVYLAGERDDDETDIPKLHRVAAYDRGGDYLGTAFEANRLMNHFIWVLSISDAPGGAVVEVGSKIRSFENSIISGLTRIVIAILVMMLVVFLTYSELRACGRCLFNYHERSKRQESDAIALLTRPLTFFVTLLASIDAVMTVLIARDLLEASGLDGSTALVAVPSIMLGLGLMIGQMLYGQLGSRLTMRRLARCSAAMRSR